MAKPVADSMVSWQNQAGFRHDSYYPLRGISQLHDEGTGGSPSLGTFPIWMSNCSEPNWHACPITFASRIGRRVGEPRAKVGSFGIRIDTGYDIGFGVLASY